MWARIGWCVVGLGCVPAPLEPVTANSDGATSTPRAGQRIERELRCGGEAARCGDGARAAQRFADDVRQPVAEAGKKVGAVCSP